MKKSFLMNALFFNTFKRNAKAFTVLELIVSMILSTIVVLIAVLAFELINLQFCNYKKTNDKMMSFLELESLLSHDFQFSKKVEWYDNNSIKFIMPDNKPFSYQLFDTCVVRTNESASDTFCLKINKIEKSFLDPGKSNLILSLKLETSVLNENYSLFFEKLYAADFLILK